jgi:hypothetical protein
MALSPITQATGTAAFLNTVDNLTQPGIAPNPNGILTPVAQKLSTPITPPTLRSTTGADALMSKAQGQYSNKQFIAPFSYTQNVEGVMVQVDYLGKKIKTNSSMPYRSIVSLSAIVLPPTVINDPADTNPADRVAKQAISSLLTGSPTQNAATQIFGTGINSITNSLAGRTAQFTSLAQLPTSQLFSNLQSTGTAALQGQLNSLPAFANINQTVANLPGFNIATNALGQLPGGSSIVSALTNPVGTATDVITQTLTQGLNIQGGLPSVSLGSLTDLFSLASSIASNGPPTSLTGAIALEKQVKSIVCNFVMPILTIPDLKAILNFKFPNPLDTIKKIETELENEISNIINSLDIVQLLQDLLPDPHAIYDAIVKEITTCDTAPTNKQNAKNGKSGGD